MAFLYHKLSRRLLLALILVWSVATFWFIDPALIDRITVFGIGIVSLCCIIFELSPVFLLIFLSFTSAYSFYGLFFQYNIPTWLIMLAILVIFGYLFTYTEQKIGILGNKRLIYLLLFSIIILELFVVFSYFLINPLSQSLLIATMCYLFVGFSYTILAKRTDSSFLTYVLVAAIISFAILVSSPWSV